MYEFRPSAVVRADAELAVAFRDADQDAVRSLVARYGGLVHGIASAGRSDTDPRSGATAGDVTVHTFLQAWRNAEVFEPGQPFGPWLANLAVRVARADLDPPSTPDPGLAERFLTDPSTWVDTPVDMADRVVGAILAESTVGPGELYTAADVRAAQESGRRGAPLRSFVVGAIAALVLLVLGVMVLSVLGGSTDDGSGDTIELRPTGRLADVGGSIEVLDRDEGLRIVLDAPSLGGLGDQWYEGWVLLDDGSNRSAGTFTTGDGVELTAAVAAASADQFLVVLSDGDPASFAETDVVLRAPLT